MGSQSLRSVSSRPLCGHWCRLLEQGRREAMEWGGRAGAEKKRPRAAQECFLECPCGDECGCRVCEDDHVIVPTFYWTLVL